MKYDFPLWFRTLKNHAANCRASRPLPGRDALSWPQTLQYSIIKGSLQSWIKKFSSSRSPGPGEPTGPAICMVFTSTCPGLVAAKEIMQGKNIPLVSLYPEELSNFLQSFPDAEYKYHLYLWSHFLEEPDSETKKIARCYPLNDKERYWLHVEGIIQGPQRGRGVEHLWSWSGSQTKLLKKSFRHWAT